MFQRAGSKGAAEILHLFSHFFARGDIFEVLLDSLQVSCGTSVYLQYSGSTPNKIYIYFAIKGISFFF